MARIKLNDITIDPAVGIREGTDEDTIQCYIDTFDELPPILYQTTERILKKLLNREKYQIPLTGYC